MTTRESLGIYWQFEDGHQEVDGMTFYGFWETFLPNDLDIDPFKEIWKTGEYDLKLTKFIGDDYCVYGISMYIKSFPTSAYWLKDVKSILTWLVDAGACVSWCGAEDCSPNPEVFNSQAASGNVYACYVSNIGFICNADLDDNVEYLNDEQLDAVYHIISKSA